jgi:hypothetical protein
MIEFSKIFCDLHPNELISNYCSHCTHHKTQNSAISLYVLLAFAVTLSLTSKEELLLSTKTSGLPTQRCRTVLDQESLPFSIKNQELYIVIDSEYDHLEHSL